VLALPAVPSHLLTVAEYLEMGELDSGYSELVEGNLLLSPRPVFDHNHAIFEFGVQARAQLPPELQVGLEVDVDLQLTGPDVPGTVRRPDLIIVSRDVRRRQGEFGYSDSGAVTGTFTTDVPFPLTIDLDALL
jgi:Putative restriction endonuclease